jgi:hypothetical protein
LRHGVFRRGENALLRKFRIYPILRNPHSIRQMSVAVSTP